MEATKCRKAFPESKNVARIEYDPTAAVLEVEFKHGGVYQYKEVPQAVFDSACEAESVGSFIAREVRGKFESVKLPAEPAEA